jgi:surface polysaccharide O-acyltransferase-like enzyme
MSTPPKTGSTTPGQSKKLFYIDNLKIILTTLVVLHHTVIAYGGAGGWYYTQKTTLTGAILPMTIFVSLNQSFFMGLFFLLAAFFTPSSFDRKGASRFLSDRLLRLGVPLLFYSFIFSPFVSFLVYYYTQHRINYWQYLGGYDNWIEFGVLWFVAALLLFTLVYVLWRKAARPASVAQQVPVPSIRSIILFAIALGVVSFVTRIVFPVGWVLKPFGFQLGHFPQYIALFMVGLLAYRNGWFEKLPDHTGKKMGIYALRLLWFFPVFYIIRVTLDMPIAWYSGGFHWQSLLYAVWEQCMGISIITALLTRARRSWNKSSARLTQLSRTTFAVYIFHPLVVVSLSLLLMAWPVDPAVKLLLAAPAAVIGAFLLGALVLKIPGVRRII